jgi:dihydrofolate synthase/folylpolyglutamate synthase
LAIAGEKAGIIKPGAPLVTGARQKRVLDLFRRHCREVQAPLYIEGVDFRSRGGPPGKFRYEGFEWQWPNLALSLAGRHQYGNAGLALAVVELLHQQGLAVAAEAVRRGLSQARWPGRLEQMTQDPRVWLDGAHNPASALVLSRRLRQRQNHGRLILVLGVMADKDVDTILERLLPLAQVAIFTRPHYFRAAKPEALAARAGRYPVEILSEPQVSAAIRRAQQLAGPEDRIVISGSLYTVGEAKEYFETFDQTAVVG